MPDVLFDSCSFLCLQQEASMDSWSVNWNTLQVNREADTMTHLLTSVLDHHAPSLRILCCGFLHCTLAAMQCIVIGPVCLWVCVCVGESVTTITRNCVHRSSPSWVCRQWLKWFCEAGGSPDEAKLEQTPYPFQPTNLALFRHKITLYRFSQGAHTIAGGAQMWAGAEPPPPSPPHFNHCL